MKFKFLIYRLIIFTLPLCFFLTPRSSFNQSNDRFYNQLESEEFSITMIPKEEFLLGIVESVNGEIRRRLLEGADISELGVDEVVPKDQVTLDDYEKEVQRIVELIDEIARLERLAKRKTNLEVLGMLSDLKSRVREILNQSEVDSISERGVEEPSDKSSEEADTLKFVDNREVGAGTIDNIMEQLKYNRILEYRIKLVKYKYLRKKLLESGTQAQTERMFKEYLKRSLQNYSDGNMQLSRLQLMDILKTYSDKIPLLDDVLYYASESSYGLNYFDEAMNGYYLLIKKYPSSEFCAKALVKIIYISYIYEDFSRLSETYQTLLSRKESLDAETLSNVSYLVGYAYFKSGLYSKTLKTLENVAPQTSYFYPSLYLSATCYSNLGRDDLAITLYQRLINTPNKGGKDPLLSQIQNNSLLKLGLIYYERGENQKAITYLNSVSEDSPYYDLTVLGKAWSSFKAGKPIQALQNVQWIMENSMMSGYGYEAMVLAAGVKELLGYKEEAIADLKKVYDVSRARQERSLEDRSQQIQNLDEAFLQNKGGMSQEYLDGLKKISRFLNPSGSNISESNNLSQGEGLGSAEMILTIRKKIEALDQIESRALAGGDRAYIEQIRRVRSNLIKMLQEQTSRLSALSSSATEEDPLISRMGMMEYLRYVFRSLLQQTIQEKMKTKNSINEADKLIKEAINKNNFRLTVQAEIKKEELEDYYNKLNQYEIWLRENFPQQYTVELDRWATFSGYGISNINFSRIKDIDTQIEKISRTIDMIDDVFAEKKRVLEQKIKGLLEDVERIENKMKYEAEKKQQTDRDRFFKTRYFEKKEKESTIEKIDKKKGKKKLKEIK